MKYLVIFSFVFISLTFYIFQSSDDDSSEFVSEEVVDTDSTFDSPTTNVKSSPRIEKLANIKPIQKKRVNVLPKETVAEVKEEPRRLMQEKKNSRIIYSKEDPREVYKEIHSGTFGKLTLGFKDLLNNDDLSCCSNRSPIKELQQAGSYNLFFFLPDSKNDDTSSSLIKYKLNFYDDKDSQLRIERIQSFAPPVVDYEVPRSWTTYKASSNILILPVEPFLARLVPNIKFMFNEDQQLANAHERLKFENVCRRLLVINHEEIYAERKALAVYCDSIKKVKFKVGIVEIALN